MESDESMHSSSGSSSESSENFENSQASPPTNKDKSPSLGEENQFQLENNSRTSTPNSEHIETHSDSRKSRSSSSSSSSGNEEGQQNEEIETFDRQRSQSLSSTGSIDESREDGISENPSNSPMTKFRGYSTSPNKSRRSSTGSHQSIQRSEPEIGNLNHDSYKKDSYDDKEECTINISHEDLSDVSDMENEKHNEDTTIHLKEAFHNNDEIVNNYSDAQSICDSEKEIKIKEITPIENEMIDLRQKLDAKKNQGKNYENNRDHNDNTCVNSNNTNGKSTNDMDDLVKNHDEDALDFEAEEGECQEIGKENLEKEHNDLIITADKEKEGGEELEEGEVSDEDEKRPEETEPKPVCRFYTRGACTWGMSCRFLHPGVTDKGNYTMFDMIRPVPIASNSAHPNSFAPYSEYRERPSLIHRPPPIHHSNYNNNVHSEARILGPTTASVSSTNIDQTPPIESAWERGLRTAKEMMRKANKRKEQDMDFEDKKMNLTLSPDELEKDNYYIRDRGSPEANPPYAARAQPATYAHDTGLYSPPPHRIPLRAAGVPPYDEIDLYGRSSRYRELPPHRMPQYEDERRVRPTREVIVQRIEPSGRGDEWSDPWMRSKSPGGRDRDKRTILRRVRSYSSNSSYSSSSTSRSGSSSETSRSLSPETRRRRYNSGHSSHKSPGARRHIKTGGRSPSPSGRRRRSTSYRRSPTQKKRHMSHSLSPRRTVNSPGNKRKRTSPHQKRLGGEKGRNKKKRGITSSSGSGSSDSSGSESETSYSSSSSSSSHGKTPVKRSTGRTSEKTTTTERKFSKKNDVSKKRSPISIELKKTSSLGASALSAAIERDNNSNSNSSSTAVSAKKTTRREELLKQLRAVEDAIARKKSKLS